MVELSENRDTVLLSEGVKSMLSLDIFCFRHPLGFCFVSTSLMLLIDSML